MLANGGVAEVASDAVRVWSLAPAMVTEEELDGARHWLDDAERARAASFVRPSLARDYEAAHAFLRERLGDVLDRPPESVRLSREPCAGCGGPHGRPVTDGTWFSLSHTDGLVLVAVAPAPVGLDVERLPTSVVDVVRSLHPREQAEIAASPAEAVVRFARAWTRTEALLKAMGVGLLREPSADYVGTGPEPVRYVEDWTIQDLRVPAGYAAAVAFA